MVSAFASFSAETSSKEDPVNFTALVFWFNCSVLAWVVSLISSSSWLGFVNED